MGNSFRVESTAQYLHNFISNIYSLQCSKVAQLQLYFIQNIIWLGICVWHGCGRISVCFWNAFLRNQKNFGFCIFSGVVCGRDFSVTQTGGNLGQLATLQRLQHQVSVHPRVIIVPIVVVIIVINPIGHKPGY